MKVLIIEDEKPASGKLVRLLKEVAPDSEILGILESVEQSINWFHSHPEPELVFMDIQLEDGISFEIFESYPVKAPVIFTTAFDTYTLKAFKVNSVDYLLKPIDPDELRKAIDKFKHLHINKSTSLQIESLIRQLQPKTKERFLIRIGEHYRSIPITGIYCFYIQERCNFIFTDTGKSYPVDYSLDKIEQLVDSDTFFRVNRNFIIRFSAIRDILAYSSNRLKITLHKQPETEEIIVSRDRVNAFKEWMDR